MTYEEEPDLLLAGFCIMIGLVITILDLVLIKVVARDSRNIFSKLLLSLIYSDTLQCIIVIFPYGINQWTGGLVMTGQICTVSGLVNYVGEKVSTVLILMLGLCRYEMMKDYNAQIPDSVVLRLLLAIVMFVILTAGLPFLTAGVGYQYNVVSRMCVWFGDDTGNKLAEVYLNSTQSPRLETSSTLDLSNLFSFTLPHLLLTSCIGYITYLSTPYIVGYTPRPLVSLQAITSTPKPGKSALTPNEPEKPGTSTSTMIGFNRERRKITIPRPYESETISGSRESVQLTLAVEDQDQNYSVSRTIYFLLVMFTAVSLPRCLVLLLDYSLRIGWHIYIDRMVVLIASSLSNFARIIATSVVLWWRITSIRYLLVQDSQS